MSLKKRLQALEFHSVLKSDHERRVFESSQRDLCCPLPAETTPEEFAEALTLLTVAHAAIQVNRDGQAPLATFKNYAIALHRKYGGPFAGEGFSHAER